MMFNQNLFTGGFGGGDPDPIFQTEDEHNQYYIQKVLEAGKTKYPDLYTEYFNKLKKKDHKSAMSLIAAMGGIPRFVPPAQGPQAPAGPSRILDIDQRIPSVGGYRYNVGPGLPARGSITNRRRRRRPY